MATGSNASNPEISHDDYRVAVYSNLCTGTVFGEGQETCRYSSNF
jgi:hypothetical protein